MSCVKLGVRGREGYKILCLGTVSLLDKEILNT